MTYETSLCLRHSVRCYAKTSKKKKERERESMMRDPVLEKQDQEKITSHDHSKFWLFHHRNAYFKN